jgi:hypothetical protein
MSPVKRRRRLPTLVNRGLGLLEVILPRGLAGEGESCLPPGQRDATGFWYPAGYEHPGDIFTPQQRQLQAAQRSIQRRRTGRDAPPAISGEAGGSGPPIAPPGANAAAAPPAPLEVAVPLPSPLPEAFAPRAVSKVVSRAPGAGASSPAGPAILPRAE